jgi:hypothetical protein
MNSNLQKRYNAYVNILFVIVIVLVIIFVTSFIQGYFPFIPSYLFNIIYIVLISFLIIYCSSLYFEIQKHDNMDFDKLRYAGINATNSDVSGSYDGMDVSMGGMGICMNNACCSAGTEWNPQLGQCIPLTNAEGFSSINNNIQPFSACEFADYSKY